MTIALLILKIAGILVAASAGIWGVLVDNPRLDIDATAAPKNNTDRIAIILIIIGGFVAIGSEIGSWFVARDDAVQQAVESQARTEQLLKELKQLNEAVIETAIPLTSFDVTASLYILRDSLNEDIRHVLDHDVFDVQTGRAYAYSLEPDEFADRLIQAGLQPDYIANRFVRRNDGWSVRIWSSHSLSDETDRYSNEPDLVFDNLGELNKVRIGAMPVGPPPTDGGRWRERSSCIAFDFSSAALAIDKATSSTSRLVRVSDLAGGRLELNVSDPDTNHARLQLQANGRLFDLPPHLAERDESAYGVTFRWFIEDKER